MTASASEPEKLLPVSARLETGRVSPDVHVRQATLAAIIVENGTPPSLPEMVPWLSDPDANVRRLAVEVLRKMGPPGVPALTEALGPEQPLPVRIAAASALAESELLAAAATEMLCRCILQEDDLLRQVACIALGKIGPDAVPCLQGLLKDAAARTIAAVLDVFGAIGEGAKDAAGVIEPLLESPDATIRAAAACALMQVAGPAFSGTEILRSVLTFGDESVRKETAVRIGLMRQAGRFAVPLLLACLKDTSSGVRAAVALALGRVGEDGPEGLQALVLLLGDSDLEVRKSSLIALSSFGTVATPALPAISKLGVTDTELSPLATEASCRIKANTAT